MAQNSHQTRKFAKKAGKKAAKIFKNLHGNEKDFGNFGFAQIVAGAKKSEKQKELREAVGLKLGLIGFVLHKIVHSS